MNLVIFDLETTGFSPRQNEIIQIAAVRVRDGQVLTAETDRFETFVRPSKPIPWFISNLTGIWQDDTGDAPEAEDALRAFSRFVGDATLVAHNGARFDIPFIRETCLRAQLPVREVPFFDSLTLSRRLWTGETAHGLDAVKDRLGVSSPEYQRHDARADVAILAEAVCRMLQQLGLAAPPTEIGLIPA
jgi:DNA polymerase III subunit epsilon